MILDARLLESQSLRTHIRTFLLRWWSIEINWSSFMFSSCDEAGVENFESCSLFMITFCWHSSTLIHHSTPCHSAEHLFSGLHTYVIGVICYSNIFMCAVSAMSLKLKLMSYFQKSHFGSIHEFTLTFLYLVELKHVNVCLSHLWFRSALDHVFIQISHCACSNLYLRGLAPPRHRAKAGAWFGWVLSCGLSLLMYSIVS